MPRVHCASCGAPSVLGASRCPKCLAPFAVEGPMSGMILAEEETPVSTTSRRWVGPAVFGLLVTVAITMWAVFRSPTEVPTSEVPVSEVPASKVPDGDGTSPLGAETKVAPTSDLDRAPPAEPAQDQRPRGAESREGAPEGRPTPAQPAGTRYRAVDWVWLRAGPNNRSERLLVVKPNQIVRSTSRRFGWIQVTVGDQEGWVSGEFLEPIPQ